MFRSDSKKQRNASYNRTPLAPVRCRFPSPNATYCQYPAVAEPQILLNPDRAEPPHAAVFDDHEDRHPFDRIERDGQGFDLPVDVVRYEGESDLGGLDDCEFPHPAHQGSN